MLNVISSTFSRATPQQLTRWLAAFILVSLVAYLGLAQSITLPKQPIDKLFSAQDYVIFLLLALCSYAFRNIRWLWMSYKTDLQVPIINNSIIYISGFALSATPGHVAELAKIVFLKPFNVPASSALSLIFNDRFLDLCTAVLFAGLLIFYIPNFNLAIGMLTLGISLVLVSMFLLAKLNIHSKLKSLLNALRAIHKPSVFSMAFIFSIFSWASQSGIFYLIVNQFIELDIFLCAGIYMAALSLGAISMMPGGIGAAEISIGGLLTLMGADLASASFIALFTRLFTFWPALILGWLCLLILSIRDRKYD